MSESPLGLGNSDTPRSARRTASDEGLRQLRRARHYQARRLTERPRTPDRLADPRARNPPYVNARTARRSGAPPLARPRHVCEVRGAGIRPGPSHLQYRHGRETLDAKRGRVEAMTRIRALADLGVLGGFLQRRIPDRLVCHREPLLLQRRGVHETGSTPVPLNPRPTPCPSPSPSSTSAIVPRATSGRSRTTLMSSPPSRASGAAARSATPSMPTG